MKFNFKKVSAVFASMLMLGMTAGVAAAASYPAPFSTSGASGWAVVYGASAPGGLDQAQATSVAEQLQDLTGAGVSLSDAAVSLDSSSTRIWLNTSLNTAKSSLTKTEMPTILADTTFSGNVDAKITHTIKLQSGAATGSDNSGKVIFSKQPKSSNDPVVGISMGTSATSNPLYNASAILSKAVNFTNSDSEGEDITLFGQKFTVSSSTDSSNLILLKEAQTVSLSSDDAPTASVTVGGAAYTIELVAASDTGATIKVTDSAGASSSQELIEAGASKKVQGLEVAVKNADETNIKLTATVIAGAQKVTLAQGANVKVGTDDTSVDGTRVDIVGGTTAATEIAITVFAPSTSKDAIVAGSNFVDPVFGSFQFSFDDLSTPLDDSGREIMEVGAVGDDTLSLKMTDHRGNAKTFDWAHNQSNQYFLGDDSNFTINAIERANLTEDEYVVLGNEEYGYFLQVDSISNDSSTAGSDSVQFRDVFSGETIKARSPTTEGSTTLSLGGKEYTVTYQGPGSGSGSGGWAQLKYPTGDSPNASTFVVYPTIQTKGGALAALYQPLTISLTAVDGTNAAQRFEFPDGDGYTSMVATNASVAGTAAWNFTVGSTTRQVNTTNSSDSTVTNGVASGTLSIGQLTYAVYSTSTVGTVQLRLTDPDATSTSITTPALIVFEAKDDSNNYEVIVIDAEAGDGTSTDGVGISSVSLTSPTQYSATLQSDSDVTKYVDWYGTLVTVDAGDSDQQTATLSYPGSQVYAKVYVDSTAAVSGEADLGSVLVTDAEVASVSGRYLVVVGGSCINTVAAELLGVSSGTCGSAFTSATGVGTGQYLIQSFSRSGKAAVLVAGYEAGETAAGVSRLLNQGSTVDTSVGKKYVYAVGTAGQSTLVSSS